MLEKVRDGVFKHPNFKRSEGSAEDGSELHCVVHHPDDKNRELLLTVLAFDVPCAE
jgi:hypothetical protein